MKYTKNNSFLILLLLPLGMFITSSISAADRICNTINPIETWHECTGTFAYKKDQQYQGYFRKGKPDGVGIATFANGYKYIGEFKNGEYEGLGAITDKSEKILQGGVWEAGRFVQSKQIDLTQFTQGGSSGPIKVTALPTPQEPPKQLYKAQATPPSIRDQPRISPPPAPLPSAAYLAPEIAKTTLQNPPAEQTANKPIKPPATGNLHKRLALVIGNDTYQNVSKLENAREDARVIAQNFQNLGYQVTLRTDLIEKQMKATIRNFVALVEGGDEVIIYYAGHGVQLAGANYLLPVDIAGENEAQVRDEAIQLQKVLDELSDRKAKFTLAVLDACRDNPFKTSGRAIGGRGLANTTAATGQMIVFSAGSGQQALDKLGPNDKNKNGLFTRIFVKEMQKPGLSIDRVIKNVRKEVVDAARSVNHEQVPSIYDQVVGDFYFKQ
jgi:hypothetical protein